jgi:hypothetical protein
MSMWTFLFSFLFLRQLGLSKPVRYLLVVFMCGLSVVILIYTVNLFLTIGERTSAPHVHRHSAH